MKFLPQPANNVVYFRFKFHQNWTRFSAVFFNLFIHSLKILMWLRWISDHRTSNFKKSITPKLFRAGHRFFQWFLMIPKSNSSKNFSTLGGWIFKGFMSKRSNCSLFFFCHSYSTSNFISRKKRNLKGEEVVREHGEQRNTWVSTCLLPQRFIRSEANLD